MIFRPGGSAVGAVSAVMLVELGMCESEETSLKSEEVFVWVCRYVGMWVCVVWFVPCRELDIAYFDICNIIFRASVRIE